MPVVRKYHGKMVEYDVVYLTEDLDFDGTYPPIDDSGKYVPVEVNLKDLIHGLTDDSIDSDEEETLSDYSYGLIDESTQLDAVPPEPDNRTPIQTISDLIFKKTLFYGGLYFDGVAKGLKSASGFVIEACDRVQIPVADNQMEQLLRIEKPKLSFNQDFKSGLKMLQANIGYEIGCSMDLFKLKFKALYVQTEHEVVRFKDKKTQNQFGTVFIQPPAKYMGGEMKVYRKLNTEGDQKQEIHLDFGADAKSKASKWHFAFISDEAEYEIDEITSGSRLMLVFAATWVTDLQPEFPGPVQIDQIATKLKQLSAKDDFLVFFLDDINNILFEMMEESDITKADQNLIRQLDAANNRLEKPFKLALVKNVRHFVYKEHDNGEEMEALVVASNADTVDADWRIKECKIEQKWFDLSGKPWPHQPKANLEMMANILNPKKKSLKQLWGGAYATQLFNGIPSQDNEPKSNGTKEEGDFNFYKYDATKTVTYEQPLLVLWPSELPIERVAEMEGWDCAFQTLIEQSPDSAALMSFMQFFKKKIASDCVEGLVNDETIRLIYDCIVTNGLFGSLPAYTDSFFSAESALKPIFLASNKEIWKNAEPGLFCDLKEYKASCLRKMLEMDVKDLIPFERRYKVLQEILKVTNSDALCKKKDILQLVMTTLSDTLVQTKRASSYIETISEPESAPLRDKYWAIWTSMLDRRIDQLKTLIAEPFDEGFPDLEAIFPKDSAEARWLMKEGSFEHHFDFDGNKLEKVNQLERLMIYKRIFSTKMLTFNDGTIRFSLEKTEEFKRHQFFENMKKSEEYVGKLKDNADQELSKKKRKIEH